ncbi:hypothetical protein [Lawsonibacter celer]|uniref:hypothetical protein n=1 Tax=Lawsonibacter celer TaxID=2986526 RepID=UPI00311A9C0D
MRHRWMCAPMMILCLILAACGGESGGQAEQLALDIRGEYLEMASCAGQTEVIADYGQRVYEYGISFQWEREGDLVLTVTAPVEAAGITARVSGEQTSLEYDGVRLETGPLNEDGLSPIDAIPALLRALREDFIAECGMEKLGETHTLRLCCRAPENTAGVGEEITLWLHPETHALLRGEVSQDGFTVIQCTFTEFTAG